jgi:hypothetical protein
MYKARVQVEAFSGKPALAIKQDIYAKTMMMKPEAGHIKWSFEQLAAGLFTISQVRRMVCAKGLHSKPTHFWKLIRNPVYCGIIRISANQTEKMQFVRAINESLISETFN